MISPMFDLSPIILYYVYVCASYIAKSYQFAPTGKRGLEIIAKIAFIERDFFGRSEILSIYTLLIHRKTSQSIFWLQE